MKALLFITCLLLCACNEPDYTNGNKPDQLRSVEIEGCGYWEYNSGSGQSHVYSLTHKGNCKNPIHIYAKP